MGWREHPERLKKNYKFLTDQLMRLSEAAGHFIYSSESLYQCSEIQIIAIDKFLSRFFEEIIYVVYIRNPVDFLVSMYAYKILYRHNNYYEYGTQEYSEFLKKCASDLIPYGAESSYQNLFNWSHVLGGKLKVRLLESDWLVKGDLIEDFASLAGVASFDKPSRMNDSIAAKYIEYVRFLNREFRYNFPGKIRGKILAVLRNASSRKPKLSASVAQANSIRKLHREQDEKIRKIFFPYRPYLFAPKIRGRAQARSARRKSSPAC